MQLGLMQAIASCIRKKCPLLILLKSTPAPTPVPPRVLKHTAADLHNKMDSKL